MPFRNRLLLWNHLVGVCCYGHCTCLSGTACCYGLSSMCLLLWRLHIQFWDRLLLWNDLEGICYYEHSGIACCYGIILHVSVAMEIAHAFQGPPVAMDHLVCVCCFGDCTYNSGSAYCYGMDIALNVFNALWEGT